VSTKDKFIRACCALVLVAIDPQALRAQYEGSRAAAVLRGDDGTDDGLDLDIRSTPAVQNTTATIRGKGLAIGQSGNGPARERAQAFLNAHAAAFGIKDPGAGIARRAEVAVKREAPPEESGLELVHFQQLHNGIPVTGGELLVHLKGNRVVSVQSEVLVNTDVATTPKISANEALKRAEMVVRRIDSKARKPEYSEPRLELMNRGILQDGDYPTLLTWFVEVNTERLREFVWIDANTGGVVLKFNQRPSALNRKIYSADSTDTLPGRLIRSEGGAATGDPDADLAYLYAGDTYNYYLTQHGRDSFDGAGAALIQTVHYCDAGFCPMQNAFWNGKQMVYGDGFAKGDDVVGHELTHAVVEHTANLFYYMQSGALNESYADIFGETIDLTNGRGNDSTAVRWKMGEDLAIGAIRDMMNPWTYGNPGKVSDWQWQTDQNSDAGGVHTNSGVPNLAFALMVDGGAFNGRTVTAIGLQAAAKIQYRALTRYLTSGANFLDNYKALLQACQDLVGTSGITATTCAQAKAAAEAVEMHLPIPFNAPVPALCPTGQTVTTLFSDDFDGTVTGNWSKRILRGTGSWVVPDTGWSKSGTHMAWGEDFETFNDAALEMAKSFTLPSKARLQFNHGYAFETDFGAAYDGGVIEVSEDGGATWRDVGNLIVAGDKYDPNAPIYASSGNSLAGRLAFVGSSYGYTASQLDLTSLAGKSVRFRFRVGTDELVGNTGWVVDDVRLYSCSAGLTISGKVTKAGVSLAGVTVSLTGTATGTKTTDANGAFSFPNLPAGGNYVVTPSLANNAFTPANLTYNNLQANQTAANFTAIPAFTISGKVTKAGVALAGVTINLTGTRTGTKTTDANGAFSFPNLPSGGNYVVTPSLANNAFTPANYTYNNLQANQTAANFAAVPAFMISGKVTKAGVALAGVTMRLTGTRTGTKTTDANGAFSFPNLPSGGNYVVTPSLANYAFTPASLAYNNLQTNQTAASFAAVPAFTISGRVTKAGVALAGVTISLTGTRTGTKTTDANGAFSFPNLPAGGNYTVKPSLANHNFTPPSIAYSNLRANQTAANFTAAATSTISRQLSPEGVEPSGPMLRAPDRPGGAQILHVLSASLFADVPMHVEHSGTSSVAKLPTRQAEALNRVL
jgi:bacillolysin